MTFVASRLAQILIFFLCLGAGAQASSCAQASLESDIAAADAIFTGEITSVRYRERERDRDRDRGWFEFPRLCATQSDGPRCGDKVALVTVDRAWKGDVGSETTVYSEDGCNCLGGYFDEGERMVFMVARWAGDSISNLGPIDYRTAYCARNVPLDYAIEQGMIDAFDLQFPPSE